MANNGSKETNGKVVKMCPFLAKRCIGAGCALWIQLFHQKLNSLGARDVTQEGKCSLPALCEIMSSRPPAPAQPPQLVKLPPNLLKG